MKILIIGNTSTVMLNFRKEFIIKLLQNGFEVFVLANSYTESDLSVLISMGVSPLNYNLNTKGLNPVSDLLATIEIAKIIRRYNIDIAFPYFVKPVIFTAFAAKFSKRCKVIGMIEGLGNVFISEGRKKTLKSRLLKWVQVMLYRLSLPSLNTLILLNEDDERDLIKKYNISINRLVILGGIGVDLNQFSFAEISTRDHLSFLFIARLLREKGIFEFLEAAEFIKAKYPDVGFKILGDFDMTNPYALNSNVLNKYIDKGIIEYPGYVSDVRPHLISSSVFVLPSFYREGVPRSIQEAMAIGRPIITTDVPGCRDTIEDGVEGFIVPPRDVDALASAMLTFIENPDLLVNMGHAARRTAEAHYDVNKVNDKLFKIIMQK